MIDPHLPDIGLRPLGVRILEVGLQIAQRRRDRIEFASETVSHQFGCGLGSAGIVVQKHEGDVVPVLGLASGMRRRDLGQKKSGQVRNIHLGATVDTLDPGAQFAYRHVARREAGAAEIQGS